MTRLVLVLALSACSITPKPVAAPPVAASVDVPVSNELALRRGRLISWLHDYRVAGVFPTDDKGPISVFVDAHGVRCPMAEMIHLSGRDDLVEAVHRENNAVRLADVHSGPLYNWMLSSGLTQEEVALVQGAMNLDQQQRFFIEGTSELATANIEGKLEMAEAALESATPQSLPIATRRLPNVSVAALASTPIAGAVVLASR
jgi:hypothetical protein